MNSYLSSILELLFVHSRTHSSKLILGHPVYYWLFMSILCHMLLICGAAF